MPIKLTYEEIKEYIESFGYKLLSNEYKNNKTKLKIKCPKGHIFEMSFNSFKNGTRCPKCGGTQKLTYNEVKEYIENFKYKLLSTEYINNRTKLKLECSKGHIFEMTFNNFKNGARCPYCNGNVKLTYNEVKKYIESFGYKLLSRNYENNHSKLKIMCDKGHIYETSFKVFKKGFRCPHCSNKAKYTLEKIEKYLNLFDYKLISDKYINANVPIKVMCPEGHIFEIRFSDFKNNNRRCPICNSSRGEQEVSFILNKLNIKFKREYKFNDCKFKTYLPFDFYLPNYNCCIEFDGIQHHEIIGQFGGFNGFVNTKIRDTIKTEYCKKNNIKLIRIPYWDIEKIEEIIIKQLIKCE